MSDFSSTRTTADFVQPATGASVTVSVGSSTWMTIGSPLFVQGGGQYFIRSLPSGTQVQLTNAADAGNTAAGTTIAAGALLTPGGGGGLAGWIASLALNSLGGRITGDINIPLAPMYNADLTSGRIAMHTAAGGAVGPVGDYWMIGNFTNTGNTGCLFTVPLGGFSRSATLTEVRARIYPFPATGTAMPTVMPRLDVYTTDSSGNGLLIGTVTDASANKAAYETDHELIVTGLTQVVGVRSIFATLSTGQGTLISGTKILGMTAV